MIAHYLHLLSDFFSTVSAAKSAFYLIKINSSASNPRKLFSMFSALLNPPSPSPPSQLMTVTYLTSSFTPAPSPYTHPCQP